jgi:hypothetical protein
MSDTLSIMFVILFIVLPGIVGNSIYMKVTGTDWREEPWWTVVRIFSISLAGLILYVLAGGLLNAPLPSYLSLDNVDTIALRRTATIRMSLAFLGHIIAAMIVGFVAGKIIQRVGKTAGGSAFADGWHEFISNHANGHWVVVGIAGGETYAGYIQMAGPEKKADKRDVILAEPAVYVAEQEKYLSLPYNYLFLPGKVVDSVAIASNAPDVNQISRDTSPLVVSELEGQENTG